MTPKPPTVLEESIAAVHAGDGLAAAIPAIQSACLNIGTAICDCKAARDAWIEADWPDATMWISNAIAQLESAREKIYAHKEASSPNVRDEPRAPKCGHKLARETAEKIAAAAIRCTESGEGLLSVNEIMAIILTALTAATAPLAEVERLKAAALSTVMATCTHHTDADRKEAGCPVCGKAESDQLLAALAKIKLTCAEAWDEIHGLNAELAAVRTAWNEREPQLLAAERKVEELRAEIVSQAHGFAATIAELRAELAAAKADTGDIYAAHSGKIDRREWHDVGLWLYPGDKLICRAAIDAARTGGAK